jgi:protein TonB
MFDATFESPRRSAPLAVSVLLHGLAATALVLASLSAVHDPPEPPERMLAFLNPLRVDPIPAKLIEAPRGSPDGGARTAASAAPRRAAAVQPVEISPTLPGPASSSASDEDAPLGAPGEDETLGFGPGTVPGPVGVPDGGGGLEILQANAPDVTPPLALVTTEPPYPAAAIHLRQQGVVILEAIIDPGGDVRSAHILRSAGPLLDRAAEQAVLRWRYRPARVGARTVAVYLTVTVRFSIPS